MPRREMRLASPIGGIKAMSNGFYVNRELSKIKNDSVCPHIYPHFPSRKMFDFKFSSSMEKMISSILHMGPVLGYTISSIRWNTFTKVFHAKEKTKDRSIADIKLIRTFVSYLEYFVKKHDVPQRVHITLMILNWTINPVSARSCNTPPGTP